MKHLLSLLVILSCLTLGYAGPATQPVLPTDARWATVIRVLDGDTILVTEQMDDEHAREVKIRFRGVNAPEMKTPEGPATKAYVELRLTKGTQVILNGVRPDNYYRLDAYVWYKDKDNRWISLSQELLDAKLAKPYK